MSEDIDTPEALSPAHFAPAVEAIRGVAFENLQAGPKSFSFKPELRTYLERMNGKVETTSIRVHDVTCVTRAQGRYCIVTTHVDDTKRSTAPITYYIIINIDAAGQYEIRRHIDGKHPVEGVEIYTSTDPVAYEKLPIYVQRLIERLKVFAPEAPAVVAGAADGAAAALRAAR